MDMSNQSHTIVDMAEVWDELTARQQQFMIMRAKALAGYNKMQKAASGSVDVSVKPKEDESV